VHTTPAEQSLVAGEAVEILDPTHRLYGFILPLVGVRTHPQLGSLCAVELCPGTECFVPMAATTRGGRARPRSCRLSVPALQHLLHVVASLPEAHSSPPLETRYALASAADRTNALPRQLPLPLQERPISSPLLMELASPAVRPRTVWQTLTTAQQAQVRQTLRRVVQDLLRQETANGPAQ
jgi:hypothetical protein